METWSDPKGKLPGSQDFGIPVKTGFNWDEGIAHTGSWEWAGTGGNEGRKLELERE